MSPFVWWVLPVVVMVAAASWAGWVRRERKPPATADSVAAYERLRAALRAGEAPAVAAERAGDRTLS